MPLASLLPQGVPGCGLGAAPDVLVATMPVLGAPTIPIAVPNTVALAGFARHEQTVSLELDAAANITAIRSSNTLLRTAGSF